MKEGGLESLRSEDGPGRIYSWADLVSISSLIRPLGPFMNGYIYKYEYKYYLLLYGFRIELC